MEPPNPHSEACVSDLCDRALAVLRAHGQRMTPARRAVIGVLAATTDHLDAEQVGARVLELAPSVHRATVYRTLETLSEVGVVTHVHTGRGATAYHLAADVTGWRHLHAQCRVCERMIDLPDDLLDGVAARLAAAGFTLEPHHVALSGVCQHCRGCGQARH